MITGILFGSKGIEMTTHTLQGGSYFKGRPILGALKNSMLKEM
jgi:hypothetical protein